MSLQNTYGDWLDPKLLPALPQCIAQQPLRLWMNTMEECIWRRCAMRSSSNKECILHTHITQLSCLKNHFSPDLIGRYLPYCSRSPLAKAQFYHWIVQATGRTWFVDVGDAADVQKLTPASLVDGYVRIDVAGKAWSDLTDAKSAYWREHFRGVIASCSFTGMPLHIENIAEDSDSDAVKYIKSSLGSETAAYNLTQHSVPYGDYFDKACFCNNFKLDSEEPYRRIDMTEQRLWMNATCGPKSLISNGTSNLLTTESAYIAKEDWTWPSCAVDIPKAVLSLTDDCVERACKIDSSGYCEKTIAINRSCFCNQISYDSCGGSCHLFETRIDYINWMHRLCRDVEGWHGLPQDWQRLARPTPQDIIPQQWPITPHIYTDEDRIQGSCASSDSMLVGLILLNVASLHAAFFTWRLDIQRILRNVLWRSSSWSFIVYGSSSAVVQLLGYWLVAYTIRSTSYFSHVPVYQLILFFCALPRPAWLKAAFFSLQNSDVMTISMAASALWSELILQIPTTYYMFTTVSYAWDHSFWRNSMEIAKQVPYAREFHAGAALWLLISFLGFALIVLMIAIAPIVPIVRAVWRRLITHKQVQLPNGDLNKTPSAMNAFRMGFNERIASLNKWYFEQEDTFIHRWSCQSRRSDLASLDRAQPSHETTYYVESDTPQYQRLIVRAGIICCVSLLAMWIAQWLFWVGFLGLSRETYVCEDVESMGKTDISRFCVPRFWLAIMIWVAVSLVENMLGGLDRARVGEIEYVPLASL
jgi:hypothetical protein